MLTFLLTIHVISAIVIVLVVLLQSGRGAELGAAFGGLGQVSYGSSQASVITRITVFLAVIFMSTSILLALFYQAKPSSSILADLSENQTEESDSSNNSDKEAESDLVDEAVELPRTPFSQPDKK